MNDMQKEPIAIVGIGCRFPRANTAQEYWQLLCDGKSAIQEVPPHRWQVDGLYHPDGTHPGKMVSRWGGFITDVDQFDWRTFRIPPREAKYIDPQHRLLLELAREALEDAGIPLDEVAGSATGVFIGVGWSDYWRLQTRDWSQLDGYSMVGNAPAMAANRISYHYDLKGPSMAMDAGCSSSLVALNVACQSLWSGETTLALLGAVNLMLSPDSTIMVSKAGFLSPTGECRALDARADGFVRGEGAGLVLLKPQSRITPSDRVYAWVRGVAVSHNGHNQWIVSTSGEAQEALLEQAYRNAQVDPGTVDYVELHGTGFLKGDAVELQAIGHVLGGPQRAHICRVGSVKTNIGNLEAASGMASLIKVALSLYHRELVSTLNIEEYNPDIPFAALQMAPQEQHSAWPTKQKRPLAAVNTLSFTGVNAHAILEAAALNKDAEGSNKAEHLDDVLCVLPLSAPNETALRALVEAYREKLRGTAYAWSDICYTASVGRMHEARRLALVARSPREASDLLEAFLQGQTSTQLMTGSVTPGTRPRVVYLFAQQALPRAILKQPLLHTSPAFQTTFALCDQLALQRDGTSLWGIVHTEHSDEGVYKYSEYPWLVFAFQVSLAALWRAWGIEPQAVLGEGLAEVAAAYVNGTITLEQAFEILMQTEAVQEDACLYPPSFSSADASTPLYSASHGLLSRDGMLNISHWLRHDQNPYLSVEVMDELIIAGYTTCLNIGFPSILAGAMLARQKHHAIDGVMTSSCYRESELALLETLGLFYTHGYAIRWSALLQEGCSYVSVPTYPWQREHIWLEWLDVQTISTPPEKYTVHSDELKGKEQDLAVAHSLLEQLKQTSAPHRKMLLRNYITGQVGRMLGLEGRQKIVPQQKLFEIGMDSVIATQLASHLQVELAHPLSATLVFYYPTIQQLTDYLLQDVLHDTLQVEVQDTASVSAEEEMPEHADGLDDLSVQDLETLLAVKLNSIEGNL